MKPDYAVNDQPTVETAWDAEPLPAEEVPKMSLAVGSDLVNVLEADA